MAESKELIHYQNKLCQAYDQLDFSKEPNFQECRNVIISAPPVFHDELQSKYCDLLLDSLTMGYLRYSELMKCDVMKDPCFIEYRNSVIRLSDGDPIKQIYFAVIDLLTGKSGAINKRLAQYVPAKIKRYLDEDEEMSCSDFIYCLVLPLKEGIPGMWSYLRKLIDRPGVCKGIPEMCEALESVYYGTKNEDIADALLRVLQTNRDIYLAKELLGYTYYNMQMWNNALSYLEQYEDVKDRVGIFYTDNIYFWMAWCYGKKRNYQLEEAYYRKTLEVFPEAENALNNLGYCLFKQKKYHDAEDVFRKCLSEKRDTRFAANNLVRTYLALGQQDKAKEFVQKSGYKVSKQLVARIGRPLATKKCDVDTDSQDSAADTSTINIGIKKHQFTSEKLLEDELIQRMEQGIPVFGLPLKVYQKRGVYGRQFILRTGRLDILATDNNNDLYVIELKKDSGYDDAYTQTKTYIEWVEADIAKSGQHVYGLICLNSPTAELKRKVKQDSQMRLFEYSISYTEI